MEEILSEPWLGKTISVVPGCFEHNQSCRRAWLGVQYDRPWKHGSGIAGDEPSALDAAFGQHDLDVWPQPCAVLP